MWILLFRISVIAIILIPVIIGYLIGYKKGHKAGYDKYFYDRQCEKCSSKILGCENINVKYCKHGGIKS